MQNRPRPSLGNAAIAWACLLCACSKPAKLDAAESAWAKPAEAPAFVGTSEPLPEEVRAKMRDHSWKEGCPAGLESLALLRLSHIGFDAQVHQGEMVVASTIAASALSVFKKLYDAGFPIEKIRLIDDYEASDDRSMADNNTSAFNCRSVAGKPGTFSQHAYGTAIDINPVQNPYVSGGDASPALGAPFTNRSIYQKGMIVRSGTVVSAFQAIHWGWGGDYKSIKDYQHFSSSGK
jgi:hypothetical protein